MYFRVKLTWYSDSAEHEFKEQGFIYANNYADAVAIIEHEFKDDLVSIDYISSLYNGSDILYDSDIREEWDAEKEN